MKKLLLLFLPLLFPCLIFAQTEPENYKTASTRFQKFYNGNAADSLYSCFGVAVKNSISADKTAGLIAQLQTAFGKLNSLQFLKLNSLIASYKVGFEKSVQEMSLILDAQNKIAGFFFKPYQAKTSYIISSNLTETPISINSNDATLAGSLILPAKNSMDKIPVVLIIAGSGATDRNGNGSGVTSNSYLMLADALGKAGIATLRYDKRFSGETRTTKNEVDLRFDDYVKDALQFIKQLKADQRFSKVIILGHSEGSLVGMLAAENEKVDAYVSLAGAGEVANNLIKTQIKALSPENYKTSWLKLDSLSKGLKVFGNVSDPFFRPSIQPYLISWFKYDPQKEIKKLKIPVLIVQGTTDIQVSVNDAQKLKKAKPDAKLVLIDGMNHILKPAPAARDENIATYTQSQLPLDSKLINAVTGFVNQLK